MPEKQTFPDDPVMKIETSGPAVEAVAPVIAEFSMPLRTEDEIIRRCRKVRGSIWLAVIAVLVAACWVPADVSGMTSFLLRALQLVTGLFAVSIVYDVIPALRLSPYNWLSSSSCDALATLCEEHPGLVRYRDRVRSEGRRFTQGEAEAMRDWIAQQRSDGLDAARVARERTACQRLYGVEQV